MWSRVLENLIIDLTGHVDSSIKVKIFPSNVVENEIYMWLISALPIIGFIVLFPLFTQEVQILNLFSLIGLIFVAYQLYDMFLKKTEKG